VGVFHARAIVFDLDGVLVDTMPAIRGGWAQWATDRGLAAAEVLSSLHMTGAELIATFAPGADPTSEALAISARIAALETSIDAFEGSGELLARLPPDCWAIVTSARREAATRHLEKAGLPVPAILISAEDTPRGKPDPAGYSLAATRLDVQPAECLAIEDSVAGVRAARHAGMFVVGITTTHAAHELREADLVISSLGALDVSAKPGRISVSWKGRTKPARALRDC
jgi:mannitol-1-/sugar-/sorbitol-6-phosphatase